MWYRPVLYRPVLYLRPVLWHSTAAAAAAISTNGDFGNPGGGALDLRGLEISAETA